MSDAEVIIVGAGPAGSLAAYQLAQAGISVLILEKTPFPRYKVCGGGLTHKILGKIPFDVSPVIETTVRSIVFSCGMDRVFRRDSRDPLIYCTSRDKLDHYLVTQAMDAGARFVAGEKVTGIRNERDGVTVQTRHHLFRSSLLIGADGASGIVARTAGLKRNLQPGLAWEAEVMTESADLETLRETVFLDWGSFPGGYGWVFPKSDHLSIGVGGPASQSVWMKEYYRRFREYLVAGSGSDGRFPVKGVRICETVSMKSWPIPVRVSKGPLHAGRIMVTGDAAGLTDSLTGEGIYYAVSSGVIAADVAKQYLDGRQPSLDAYSGRVNDELMPELLAAGNIKAIFNTVPVRIHHFVRDSDRAWGAFVKILRGERSYADVPRGFGRWRMLWGVACILGGGVSWFRERQFKNRGFTKQA